MDLVYGGPTTQAAQTSLVDSSVRASAISNPIPAEQTLFTAAGEVAANSFVSLTVPVEDITQIWFDLDATHPLSLTLVDPAAQLINPSLAATDPQITYTVTSSEEANGALLQYRYQIQTPADGLWQVQIQSTAAAAYALRGTIHSATHLVAAANAGSYAPGQTVLVQAALGVVPKLHCSVAPFIVCSGIRLSSRVVLLLAQADLWCRKRYHRC